MRPIFAVLLSILLAIDSCPKYAEAMEYIPPRGLVTMALLNKRFPVKVAADVISASPNPAFAFIYKSFGSHYENLKTLISSLLDNPARPHRNVTVLVYGDCGPCRSPRRPKGLFRLIAPKETISSLNRKLERANDKVLTQFKIAFRDLESKLPKRDGLDYIFQIGLEDNYTPHAYRMLRVIAMDVFFDRLDVQIGRNPAAHVNGKSHVYPIERHSYFTGALSKLKTGDIITGDGFHLKLPSDRCEPKLSFEPSAVRKLVLKGADKGIIVLLWRPDHQGIDPCNPRSVFVPPYKRRYQIKDTLTLKDLLRR